MTYAKLSDQVKKLTNPQRSDAFVKQFRNAVREGEIEAADLPGRFTLPKEFTRRGQEGTYSRDVKDMVFEVTPEFEEWFDNVNAELATNRRGAKVRPTLENIEAGLVDFRALAAATREKMEASFAKGQKLGSSRKGTAVGRKPATRKATAGRGNKK
ncbi:hypothetical protein GCM10008955_32440 [Deinococcus malanensis]|uniref:DNA-binding protein n=1 Tax=Deinococcus malanensis TaxID=1706855 RepID=A0ABQ2F3F9_9DEIO|nr:hypothetical protein [Deinococcus malanensis]GGK35987.1 hypothetical protein GCM10008955_32440 [Deinococcus malanensis]